MPDLTRREMLATQEAKFRTALARLASDVDTIGTEYVAYGSERITLDGDFTLAELEAIVAAAKEAQSDEPMLATTAALAAGATLPEGPACAQNTNAPCGYQVDFAGPCDCCPTVSVLNVSLLVGDKEYRALTGEGGEVRNVNGYLVGTLTADDGETIELVPPEKF